MSSLNSFSERFDRLRAENPELALSIYALEPGGTVTLEIITPDEQVFTFVGRSLADTINRAFPEPEPADTTTNIFD